MNTPIKMPNGNIFLGTAERWNRDIASYYYDAQHDVVFIRYQSSDRLSRIQNYSNMPENIYAMCIRAAQGEYREFDTLDRHQQLLALGDQRTIKEETELAAITDSIYLDEFGY
jgi:hypothetical protein